MTIAQRETDLQRVVAELICIFQDNVDAFDDDEFFLLKTALLLVVDSGERGDFEEAEKGCVLIANVFVGAGIMKEYRPY